MKPSLIVAVFAAIAPAFVEGTVSTFSRTGCVTKQSTKSTNKIPTSTRSATLTFKPKVTVVTTSTRTIVPTSTTVTAIATLTSTITEVLTQETDTFTATITQTEMESSTTTLISTELTTSSVTVTSTSTLTVGASAGFTPLASQLAAQGHSAGTMRKRSAPKRIAQAVVEDDELGLERRAASGLKRPSKQYPAAVSCYRFVQVISTSTVMSTAKTTKTVTATPGTITVTSTTVEPTTTTSMPIDASTTITASTKTTITNISTATSTTTSTLTTTTTSFAPMATTYPACNSDNLVSSINGRIIYDGLPTYGYLESTAANAYDCCTLCLQSDNCGSSFFSASQGNRCALINNSGTCSAAEQDIEILTLSGSVVWVVSNGRCGRAFYNGN